MLKRTVLMLTATLMITAVALLGCGDDTSDATTAQGSGGTGTGGGQTSGGGGAGGAGDAGGGGGGTTDARVLVTSQAWDGAFGGLDAADALCAAAAAALPDGASATWRAWLSDNSTDAATRVADRSPWFGVDGGLTIAVFDELTDPAVPLTRGINIDENGQFVNDHAWTGTDADGTGNGNNCDEWMNASGNPGGIGQTNLFAEAWTNQGNSLCDTSHHMYCFEQ
jgi:hypothetical protein